MKKFIAYLKSPKSDFLFFAILLILINLVFSKSYFRIDLTSPRSYSLSESSKQTVKTLEQPLSVKVFFTKNLPAPYNTVDQYLRDLLVEYKNSGNSNFSCEFFDMEKEENEKLARGYGINQVQIQELKNNEVGFKKAWMGIAVSYADRTEIIDGLSSSDGLEYTLTTTMNKLINTVSALSGLDGKAKLTLYISRSLNDFNISGFKNIEKNVTDAFENVNKKNLERIEFEISEPSQDEIMPLADAYGIQVLNWNKGGETEFGVLGLVLEYNGEFRTLPLRVVSSFFGNAVAGVESLEDDISESLKSLVSKPSVIGYVTGHGELDIYDSKQGAGLFNSLVSDRYEFKKLNLKEDDISSGMKSIVINGATDEFSDDELYKIDQFLMKGGNILFFADGINEIRPEGQAAYYQMPTYEPSNTGLDKLLSKYGVEVGNDYVMDENCYTNRDNYYGSTPLYFAPMLQQSNLAKHPITKNLGYVIMLQNSSLDVSKAEADENLKVTVLAKSSPRSWLMKDDISTIPQMIRKPADTSVMESQNLAVLIEGNFESAFDENPESENSGDFQFTDHYKKSVQKGKIFVAGTSKITTPQVVDPDGKQPVAIFVRNAVDYMNGETDLCAMRTKGLSLNTLKEKSGIAVTLAKYFNQFGLVILVAAAGLISLLRNAKRKKAIRREYNPDDKRELSK